MIVKKFLHSCILLEENGKRFLIDPGDFVFREGKVSPQDIGGVDVILFTHGHADHFYHEALKIILKSKLAVVLAHIAEEPLLCVAKGTGIALEHLDVYKRSIMSKR